MVAVYAAASFLGAALLFLVEPMLAKMVLPAFGGSPMVWNTATLFFQTLLLGAYAYVHASARRLGRRRQPGFHLLLSFAPLAVLPLALPGHVAPPPETEPALWLLRDLVLAAGLPFAILATTGPLLQRWFSWLGHARADDPYFLYASSNAGSIVGLLGYPFLVEPHISLSQQARWWSFGFSVFLALVAACGVHVLIRGRADVATVLAAEEPAEALTWRRRLGWVALAFLPSSLMLGVTTHISTDIAAVPLMWSLPLTIYLFTFVVAFARTRRRLSRAASVAAVMLAFPALLDTRISASAPAGLRLAVHLSLLLAVGLAAHGRLAADRPRPARLTEFYLLLSLGGALGGLLNGLVAPIVLDRPMEYPLVLATVPLLLLGLGRPALGALARRYGPPGHAVVPLLGAAVVSVTVLALERSGQDRLASAAAFTGIPLVAGYVLTRHARVGIGFMAVVFVATATTGSGALLRERTYFGSYRVVAEADRHVLYHGTTSHGWQRLSGADAAEPTSYYTRGGPIGDVFGAYQGLEMTSQVAVIGLGAGTLAAYGDAGQRMDFYEIDPAVVRIAQDPRLFGYLSDTMATVTIHEGDGRLQLERAADHSYGLLVLDAFSSDAIPVHLLTREAFQLYRAKLAPGGVIALHVSNRHLRLAPVVAADAEQLGMVAARRAHAGDGQLAFASEWVVLAEHERDLRPLYALPGWSPAESGGVQPWTDDYSSIVETLRFLR